MKRACKPFSLTLAFGVVLLAGGCKSNPAVNDDSSSQRSMLESDPAMLQLVSIAQNIHARTAINDQIMSERYGLQDEARMPIDELPVDLRQIISFPGGVQLPLDVALKHLSKKGGISYKVPQGTKPLSGIYVIFDEQMRTVAEFIADAARQAGYRADVVFDLTTEDLPSIQIIYKDAVL